MVESPTERITQLLSDWSKGDQQALNALAPLVYKELHQLARSYMRRERADHTLQATALVNEAYMRLVDQRAEWQSRAHFFGIAAQMMRRILVDHAKEQRAAKRGSGAAKVTFEESLVAGKEPPVNLVALNDALEELAKIDPERSRIVELRYFGGLSNEESAEVLNISTATVQRQWAGARAWLYHELSRENKK